MRLLLLPLLLLSAVTLSSGEFRLNDIIPELRLTDGRVLHAVQLVSFSPSVVMARWEGGRGTIHYENFPAGLRHAIEKYRPAAASPTIAKPQVPKPLPVPALQKRDPDQVKSEPQTIVGRVFIKTLHDGIYKFGDAQILAFPEAILEQAISDQKLERMNVPTGDSPDDVTAWLKVLANKTPVASAPTDSESNFSITVNQPVFLFCSTQRLYRGMLERCVWVITAGPSARRIDLTEQNGLVTVLVTNKL